MYYFTGPSINAGAKFCSHYNGLESAFRIETRTHGRARDELISRAKVVLNVHFYPTAIFEIVRVSYLLANRKAVVGECGPSTEIDTDIREAIAPANYDRLCDRVRRTVAR